MTPETAVFLRRLISQVTLTSGAPDFDEVALGIVKAKAELDEIIGENATGTTDDG